MQQQKQEHHYTITLSPLSYRNLLLFNPNCVYIYIKKMIYLIKDCVGSITIYTASRINVPVISGTKKTLSFPTKARSKSRWAPQSLGPTTTSLPYLASSFRNSYPLSVFSSTMASNRNGVQRGSAKFDRPLKPRPRPSSPSPGSALRRPNAAARNGDAGESPPKPRQTQIECVVCFVERV